MQEASDLQSNTKEHPDLYRRSIKGGYWVIVLRLIINVLSFGKVLVIANFFVLENLGIISIAIMLMEVLSTFTQTGFDSALVQKKENIHGYLDTAWAAGLVKGIALFLILYFFAPVLASIRVPEDKVALTISILRAMSICFLISGVRNIGTIYFQKELQFRKVFTLTLASSLTDIVLSLTFIFFFRSIWGVIAARIFASAVDCIGSYILSPYRPRFCFEYAKARELWGFGKWIYGQSILGYFLEMGDNFFVWFYLGLPQLALYKYAYDFATMPAKHISDVISSISFPAYSKIQDDIPRLREAYLKILKITAFFAIPASLLIFILGPEFVKLFLKPDFYPMTTTLQILAFVGLITGVGSTCGALFGAMGKPQAAWHLQLMRLTLLLILIYPLTKIGGIKGTALSVLIVRGLIYPVGFFYVCKMLQCSTWKLLAPSFFPTIASCVMVLTIVIFKIFLFSEINFISFLVLLSGGGAVYLVCLGFIDYIFDGGIRKIIEEQIYLIVKKLSYDKKSQ